MGIHVRTGLVTFHGPMGIAAWPPFSVQQMQRVLFKGEAARLSGPADEKPGVRTLVPGRARGRLLGGNLTVLSSIVGSPYLAGNEDLILFLEEVREPISEVDRMLTQLAQAGIMPRPIPIGNSICHVRAAGGRSVVRPVPTVTPPGA